MRNWNQFIHPGLTPSQQIIVLGPSGKPRVAPAPPAGGSSGSGGGTSSGQDEPSLPSAPGLSGIIISGASLADANGTYVWSAGVWRKGGWTISAPDGNIPWLTDPTTAARYYAVDGQFPLIWDQFDDHDAATSTPPTGSYENFVYQEDGLTIAWLPVPGALGYRLDASSYPDFNDLDWAEDLDVGLNTSLFLSNFSGGATGYFRVRAYNAAGTGPNSAVVYIINNVGQ